MLIAVMGLPGSGKSYFATRLASKLDAEYISSDVVRKRLSRKPSYTEEEKERVYKSMYAQMLECVASRKSVVLDATFSSNQIRMMGQMFVASMSLLTLHFIEIQADPAIIAERVSQKREHSEADLSVHQQIKEDFEPMKEEHLILQSTNDNIDEMLSKALEYLQNFHD